MNISSYNVTDVGYHYIGLRVLANLGSKRPREAQFSAVSANVLKYANDKSLRLMLPAPRGDFQTVGEKVCQELVHLGLAEAPYGSGYGLTPLGRESLELLNQKHHAELRRRMIERHLKTYDNLREVLTKQLDEYAIWSPVVDAKRFSHVEYIAQLLKPTYGSDALEAADNIRLSGLTESAKKTEDVVRQAILDRVYAPDGIRLPLFRSMCDRLASLRLVNIMRATVDDCEFAKYYSPCSSGKSLMTWHVGLSVTLNGDNQFQFFVSEPDMKDEVICDFLLAELLDALQGLRSQAGYYDLPQVRDTVCERMWIPEAAFDEGVNELLDRQPSPVTVGLTYEGISGRRKPLVRSRESIQIFNLLRRA